MAKPTHILVKNAREHNLKGIDVEIKRNKITVITGVSGSGKSSLAFDTIYAEGQRRYVESLSSYARQFMGKLEKPKVDEIRGLSPSVAIEQKVVSRNSRSTVGTVTEIYDYLKLLFSRIGKTISPISGEEVKKHSVSNVVDFVANQKNKKVLILVECITDNDTGRQIDIYKQQGFSRLHDGSKFLKLSDEIDNLNGKFLLIDRFAIKENDNDLSRIADSAATAFFEGRGELIVDVVDDKQYTFSSKFELDGIQFIEPTEHLFSFNNPLGACKTCEGFGSTIGIDEDLVIPNPNLSLYDDAIACWKGDKMSWYKEQVLKHAHKVNFPVHKPISELSAIENQILWNGCKYFAGINDFFKELETQSHKIQYRVMLSRYRGKTICKDCNGTRLSKESQYVKIAGHSLSDLVLLPLDELLTFFENIKLSEHDHKISERLIEEVKNRLSYICDVGLNYLSLNRPANTLSGGESQRINLATSLGSSLVGSIYILDEPSIGLHSRDTQKLIKVLQRLNKLGNTVIIVEHDEEIMEIADEIIDMGPLAGQLGGEIVTQGKLEIIKQNKESLTAKYLSENLKVERNNWTDLSDKHYITLTGARRNNLSKVDISFPTESLVVVTGVSGSGKSTLVKDILYPAISRHFGNSTNMPGSCTSIEIPEGSIESVEFIDQNPIGKSSRSNPATYSKAFDDIRALFAYQNLSKIRNYQTRQFSFNVPGGRCDECEGEGEITVEMQFIADVKLKCESCNGRRFKDETLEIEYNGKNIADVLEMTIDEAIDFFSNGDRMAEKIAQKLTSLQQVGLGYVQLGQSASTLSGGEAQRIKLASFLSKGSGQEKSLFIFDEPTTGLHFHDIAKLLNSFELLIEKGHSIFVIEHNYEIIKNADYIIDLGPEGGKKGGNILFQGKPEDLKEVEGSYTAAFLKTKNVSV